MSKSHYKVNDDIYGKILKSNKNSPPIEYAEVFEAVDGLGIIYFSNIPYIMLL